MLKKLSLDHLKLGTQLGVGFGVLIIIFTVAAVSGLWGLNNTYAGFVEYRGLARDTNLAGQLQASMLMLRIKVKDYLITHSDQDLQQYQDYSKALGEFLDQAQQQIQKPERTKLVDQIAKDIETYQSSFQVVSDFSHGDDEIIDQILIPAGQVMIETLDTLVESALQNQQLETAFLVVKLQKEVLLGRLYAAKFLDNGKPEAFQRAMEQMDIKVEEVDDQLGNHLHDPQHQALFQVFEKNRHRYIAALNDIEQQVVQSQDLVNNSLNQLGPAVAKQAEAVKLSVKADQEELGQRLQQHTANMLILIEVLVGGAIVLGILL